MNNRAKVMHSLYLLVCLRTLQIAICVGILTAGCTTRDGAPEGLPTGTPEELPTSICPSCGPSTGGETGDFPGTPRSCIPLLSTIEVDDDEAQTLGYDVAEIRRQLSRSLDLPFAWGQGPRLSVSQDNTRFELEPASGYGLDQTLISLRFRPSPALLYERIDPKYCDGTLCTDGRSVAQQGSCDGLHVELEVDVHTADDAIRGTLKGRASDRGLGNVYVWVSTDLAKVPGKLRLSPKPDLGPLSATLDLAVRLSGDAAEGTLTPTFRFDTVIGESVYQQTYIPIMGQFRVGPPEPPAGPPIVGTLAGAGGTLAGPGSGEPKQ